MTRTCCKRSRQWAIFSAEQIGKKRKRCLTPSASVAGAELSFFGIYGQRPITSEVGKKKRLSSSASTAGTYLSVVDIRETRQCSLCSACLSLSLCSAYVPLCLFPCLSSAYVFLSLFVCLCLSFSLSISLSVCLLFVCMSLSLAVSVCLSVCLSWNVCLCVSLCLSLSFSLFLFLFLFQCTVDIYINSPPSPLLYLELICLSCSSHLSLQASFSDLARLLFII